MFIGGDKMLNKESRKITAIGTFMRNLIMIDDMAIEWIDAKEFNPADLAKLIGIVDERKVRAKITLEVVEERCKICGELITGDKLCDGCAEPLCDKCAKTDATGRYCPTCYDLRKQSILL